ncbi:MAG: hypothetical protein LBF23_00865 [Endomicrobium sp.]|jgi:cupin superfamily acireductone dioxygenase involved in methionine salvage|nr:hypothetical protein [Endomicrobium sp.]
MSTDLEVSTGQSQVAVRQNEVAKKISDLERGGYYKNVVSPEEYLSRKKDSSTNPDVEIYDEQSQDTKDTKDTKNKQVAPLKHWNEKIQAKFDECTDSQKRAWLDSFKIVEKNYVKQLNYLKDDIAAMQPVMAEFEPLKPQLEKLGQTPAEYIKDLITFDMQIGANPAYEIARLISHFNVAYNDLYNALPQAANDLKESTTISKYVDPLYKELASIKAALGYSSQDTVNVEMATKAAEDIIAKVTAFFEQRDSSGKEMYPGAFEHIRDIIELVQTGENLQDAYDYVVNGKSNKEDSSIEEQGLDYDEPQDRKKDRKMNSDEKEKAMLLSMLEKINR